MTPDQFSVFAILAGAMVLFVWNHWRYDVVAGIALLSAVYTGIVPVDHAFDGFSHPAVVTVAAVLVISHALQASGVVELFLRYLAYARGSVATQLAANCGLTGFLSAFMNNIGALALMLPITLRDARRSGRPASLLLMPLSFASLLGGLVTLIGTPPNIIVATFRAEKTGESFRMFDYTPVGLVVALCGLLFLVCFARYLLPRSDGDSDSDTPVRIARYISEMRIPAGSALVGKSVGDLEALCQNEVSVIALLRNDRRRLAPRVVELLYDGDVLIIEGESEALQPLLENPGLVEAGEAGVDADQWKSAEVRIMELVVMPNSLIEGEAMRGLGMHQRFNVNLLGVAREGRASRATLRHIRFKPGDVLLIQGEQRAIEQMCRTLGCLIIRNRGVTITPRRGALLTPSVFGAGIIAAGMGWVPVQIAFTTVVGILVLMKMVSLRAAYRSIDWPVIILLGFLIPIGEALQSTGGTELIASAIVSVSDALPLWSLLALLIATSMLMSDLVHNTPTAVLMSPVAYSLAVGLDQSPDAFLMAVAVGAASPYLTPIGHQSNTLVMGPGGYVFGDYWRLGLPLDGVIIAVAVPMILWVWI